MKGFSFLECLEVYGYCVGFEEWVWINRFWVNFESGSLLGCVLIIGVNNLSLKMKF